MDELKRRIWVNVLDADMNRRYFGALASWYYHADLYSKIFLATMASGTVGGWVLWSDPIKYEYGVLFWKALSSISAVLSLGLPIVNIGKKLDVSTKLKGEWTVIMRAYDLLWVQVQSGEYACAIEDLVKIGKMEADLELIEAVLPTNNSKLILRCQKEVKHARGI